MLVSFANLLHYIFSRLDTRELSAKSSRNDNAMFPKLMRVISSGAKSILARYIYVLSFRFVIVFLYIKYIFSVYFIFPCYIMLKIKFAIL